MNPSEQVEKRKPLNRAQYLHLFMLQSGLCGCGCGVKLNPLAEKVIDEHVRPLGLLGANALENRSLWRAPCSKAKTKGDVARIAKAKRQAGEVGNQAKRPIRSAGFRKDISRGFDGRVKPRRQEEPA